ncbi:diguanylate cyclase domain-containing protein [Nocardioides nitrophenolicus]|uniref:diguanylate cyclase domain-containing protein n=1 Tax=Nocardioides nitrophenolicus TaxID=60489 RepID=UPI00195D6378|nr:diguanylate cyclase [Nocardioides nitrophenolicus]MBM7519952.1 diguanylate cyclase (GGDEF)-like protein [Nocardioides nitrophenolicus]
MARRVSRAMLPGAGFAVAYALAILAGRATRVEGSEVSLVWPAAAVAVLWGLHAAGLPRGRAAVHWAGLAALTFVVNLATHAPADLAAWFVLVNVALAAVTTLALRYGGRPPRLREPADLGRLVGAIAAGTVAAALLAVAWLAHDGQADLLRTFALFAVRNGVTALAGVAVVLRLRDARWRRPTLTVARVAETLACATLVGVVFARVFWLNPGHPNAFGVMLPAMWVSLRFSTTTSTVFLTGAGTTIMAATLLDRGALRDIAPQEQALLAQGMVGALTVVVLTLALFRDSRNELIAELRDLAQRDPLTGLANRALLNQRLEELLRREPPETVGVLLLDLDGFKLVNDAWGHDEGDLLLVEIARRLSEVARPDDTVARLGGDEFVVVCPGLDDPAELELCAERIRRRVALPYGQASDAPYDRITASVGAAVSERTSTPRSLLAAADRAMYDAKRGLRDREARAARWPAGPRAAAGAPGRG